jgi:hypothetical protein
LLQRFWARYVQARLAAGDDTPFGDARAVFERSVLIGLALHFDSEVLNTPVFFTDKLSNRTLAGCLMLRDGSCAIALNARFQVDPEVLAHTLVEEYAHAQQIRDGVDFEAQRQQFTYSKRPYEMEAKRLATDVLGYEPGTFDVLLLREEPPGLLFDRTAR